MKNRILLLFFTLSLVMVVGCKNEDLKDTSNNQNINNAEKIEEDEIGVSPYNLSEENIELLKVLNLEGKASILSFEAPRTVKSIKANIYILGENGIWERISGLNKQLYKEDVLKGTFSMIISDVNTKEININLGSSILSLMRDKEEYRMYSDRYKGDSISSSVFLEDFNRIELNKEIPVAIMVKSKGEEINSYNISSFFDTDNFGGMVYVEAVTLIFED